MLSAIKKRWYVIVLAAFLAGVGTFAYSATIPPVYQAGASLFFSLRDGDSGSDINQGLTYTQNQMLSYAELATTSSVLDKARDDIGGNMTFDDLHRAVKVTSPQNTVILEVKASATSRELAAQIANSVSESLLDSVAKVAPVDATGKPTVVARVIQPALPPKFQSAPNKSKNAVLGAFIGGAIALLGLFVSVALDTRIRSVSSLKPITDLALLGTADRTPRSNDQRPVALRHPRGAATEKYRQIRAALRFTSVSREIKTLAVTSSIPGEGKTVTSLNLALTMAEGTERILLIDGDLRRPRVASYLGLEPSIGLTTVLLDGLRLSDAVQAFGDTRLDILTSGAIPPNPSELLDSSRMRTLLAEAKNHYDVVIIDTAPVHSVSDAAIIAQDVDSTVVVVDSTKLRHAQLEQTTDTLNAAGAHISGLILNRVKPSNRSDGYYADGPGTESTTIDEGSSRSSQASFRRERQTSGKNSRN
ncbi:polysaccharide biosynthesis tyrosine autokinase [Arthrobacter rhombi]